LQGLGDRNIFDFVNSPDKTSGFTIINFPAMPDAIELVRRADYAVSTPIGFPDGIHMYKGTSVLEIPISFKLHAFDKEYCPQGVKTLLQIAAELHSLTLPFGPEKLILQSGQPEEVGNKPQQDDKTKEATAEKPTTTWHTPAQDIYPPATCYLELIITERDSVGITCVGYVKDVKARLSGPYMRGPGVSRNLPTHGEFDFTFVHHPGHGNNFQANKKQDFTEQQAFAQTVKNRLYNTVDLMTNAQGFRSFNDYTT